MRWVCASLCLLGLVLDGCDGGGPGDAATDVSLDAVADARGDVSADVSPDVSPDVAPDVAPDGSADATCDVPPTACCCSGDVLDTVTCGASGPTCRPGYGLYFGDDCQCLPGRDTPCCLPHVWDAGH